MVGGGGREHALAWALDRWGADVFCAPGNPGTADVATNLTLDPQDATPLAAAMRDRRIELAVIGPEAPLAAGVVDGLAEAGLPAFGPTAGAARIEASKAFAKDVMAAAGVPTAASRTFTDRQLALQYVQVHREPIVVKASGLAGGKGAMVCRTRLEAVDAVDEMMAGRFGEAGQTLVIEEFLEGEELSVFALTDGSRVVLLPAAQDHKRLKEGDTGPNTGGMGAYTPVAIATTELLERVVRDVLRPTLAELARRGTPYRGVLYAGLMITEGGEAYVIEFNCRLGDPEAQIVLPATDVNLLEDVRRIASGETWRPQDALSLDASRAAVTTVLAAQGYPHSPQKGAAISLPDPLPAETLLFHAGTTRDADGTLRTSGGRVLACTGLGATVVEAAERSRVLAERVTYEGKQYRRDIAWREVARAGAS